MEATVQRFGKLDVLVNNAGIFKLANVEETSSELWDEIMGINAKGVFLGTKYAIPEMRKNGGGSIVNISSVAGLIGTRYSAAYGASKGAVRLLTKSTAIQYAKDNIRANSIHPGVIETPMTAPNLLADEQARQITISRHPIGRWGQPEAGQSRYKLVDLAKHTSPRMGRAEGGVMRKGKGASIMDYFETLEDPRIDRCKRHQLLDIIAIAICAVICGADSWVYIELFDSAVRHYSASQGGTLN